MKRTIFCLCAISAILSSCSSLARDETDGRKTIDALLPYVGIYRLGSHHRVSVDVMTGGAADVGLVYTDLDTQQIRLMHRQAQDAFATGHTFSTLEPRGYTLRFRRDAAGRIDTLEWTDVTLGRSQSGVREPLVRENVTFHSGSLRLRGTLHKPACASERAPLIVWLHGSNRAQRHGLFGLPQILAHHGFAVLAYDKRGVGESEGDYITAGFNELAADGAAALAAMKTRADIDPARMGVLGTSQGGWVSFRVARLTKDVSFIVDLYGTPVTVREQMLFDLRRDLEGSGFGTSDIDSALALQARIIGYMQDGSGWVALRKEVARARTERWFEHVFISYEGQLTPQIRDTGVAKMIQYEPLADIRSFRAPLLYLLGDFDRLVDVPRSTSLMAQTLTAGGNPDFTILVLPKAHHGLTLGISGAPSERFSGLRTSATVQSLAPGYIDILVRWLQARVAGVRCRAL